ncbi:MAG: hypothetical protein K2Y56_24965, partial [Methylobacterium sp.]|uniref:hypothetical protein n=1 Tax=Methylobacterium sp. TaxID=409 RepID=UPI0026013F6B
MVAGFASERRPASNRNPRPASSEYAQDRIYIALARTATDASRHFRIPVERAVEIGAQISI